MTAPETEMREQIARLQQELAEAKRDAERGWKHADTAHNDTQDWAATCKRLMDHMQVLQTALNTAKRVPATTHPLCGAVATTTSGTLGPCTSGWHHESWPHQDPAGTRWLTLVLPESTDPDDLHQRLAAAYHQRFDNDGHPEDSQVAAEVAMAVLGPVLAHHAQQEAP